MIPIFLILLPQGIQKLMVDTQTQISGMLAFKNEKQDISIWFRAQPSFLEEMQFDPPVVFSIINDNDANNLYIFSYILLEKELIIYLDEEIQTLEIFQYIIDDHDIDFKWIRLLIHKSVEQIEYIQIDDKKINLQNFYQSHLNMIYTWQSKFYSCNIYDNEQSIEEKILILQNDVFLISQALIIYNFRQQIILLIYAKYQQTNGDFNFMRIHDYKWITQLTLNQTALMVEFNYGYQKYFNKSFDSDMINQWFQIIMFYEIDYIKCQIKFLDKVFEQIVQYKYEDSNQVLNKQLFLPIDFIISRYLQNYKIFVVNKHDEFQIISLDRFCFQNCKTCNQLQCLECEGSLSLQSNCLCPINQVFDQSFGKCIDKTLISNILPNYSYKLNFCPFREYYDEYFQICKECPKINEFYCTSCLYNTDKWQSEQSCDFQEIFQQQFIQFHSSLFIPAQYKSRGVNIEFDYDPNYQYETLDDGRYLLKYKDIFKILSGYCEKNYYFDNKYKKCKILQQGQQSRFYVDKKYWSLCNIGYILINNQCTKCPKNCLFCKFNKHKLICILPIQSYTINQKQQVIKCKDQQCQQIDKQEMDDCSIENCLICYFASCLICDSNYVQDMADFCVIGKQYSPFFTLQINDNLIKPQFDYQQMLYLKFQINRFNMELNDEDIIQLIILGNNYKAMRQDQLPQIKQNQYYNQSEIIYCLNQTQYFEFKFCHQLIPDYQYIQQQDKYVYCPNNTCLFDLTYEVVIIFSNKPSILYKNMTFSNFEHFIQSLQIDDLLIQNIIIKAIVYVINTQQKKCEQPLFFFLYYSSIFNYKVILDFQGVSNFAKCNSSIPTIQIEFNEVTILNLYTYSSINMQIYCHKIIIKNCIFKNQEKFYLNLEARKIYLEQIYIKGIHINQLYPLFNISHPDQIELSVVDLQVENFCLLSQIIIKIWSKVDQIRIQNIKLKNNEFRDQSTFIISQEPLNLRVDYLIIDNMIFEKAGIILLVTKQPNQLIINNIIIKNSQFSKFSLLFESQELIIKNFQLINIDMKNTQLILSTQNLTLQNVQVQHMNSIGSQILLFLGKFIQINQFQIINSSIFNSNDLLEVLTEQFSFRYFSLINCTYYPNIRLINIQGRLGIISYLMVSNITFDTDFKQYHVGDNFASDVIVINSDKILIQYLYFCDLINLHELMNIQYHYLYIDNVQLKKFQLNKVSKYEQLNIIKYMIQIISDRKQKSFCLIQNFRVSFIISHNFVNFHRNKLSKLTIINLIYGQIQINNLYLDNFLSQQQVYMLNAFQSQIRIYNIKFDHLQNVGILQFSSSQVYSRKIYYNSSFLYNMKVPLFKNDDLLSKNNILIIKHIRLVNLSTPLVEIKSNFTFKINIINVNIQMINLQDDIINVQLNYSTLGYLFIKKMKICNSISENQEQFYIISGNNLKVNLNFIQLRNINIGVYICVNNQQFDGEYIYISNGTMDQPLFYFLYQIGRVSLMNLIVRHIVQQNHAIIDFNITNERNSIRQNIILENLLIFQYLGESLINFIQKNQQQIMFVLKNMGIDQSQFTQSIFNFQSLFPIQFDINRLQVFQVKCGTFLLTRQNNIIIYNSIIVNLHSSDINGTQEISFISSQLYQTNILYKQNYSYQKDGFLDKILSIEEEVFPISLSFHGNSVFKLAKILNIFQVQFNNKNKVVYVPSGQQFNEFQYFNLQTLDHEQIYRSFSIMITAKAFGQNQQIKCNLKQSLDGTKVGKYSNYNEFNLKEGINIFDDFVFIMNPYQNYSFLQNEIVCNNYTLRFDVRILPCQLGEYLYQNKCITCDINKNLYSIIKKAQHCMILNPEQISEVRVGRIQLKQNYWKPSITSNLIEKCQTDQVCRGGWLNGDESCHLSRVGAICNECDIYNLKGDGQFIKSGQECLECQPNCSLLLKGFCIFLWILFITFMNYNTNKKITEKFLQFKIMNRMYSDVLMRQSIDQFSIIIKIYINYVFIIYLVQDNLQFLDNKILLALNFISNPGLIITTELDCILVKSLDIDIQYIELAQSLISPFIILMIVFFIYIMSLALKLLRYHFNIIVIISYSVYLFNQQIIIQTQIKLLSYRIISGIKWIYSNQQFQFYTSKHIKMIAIFIAPTTIILLVIPLIIFYLLKFRDKRSIWCIKKYGIIYCDYKQNAYFQEIIRIYTKHIVIFLLYFLNYVDQSILIMFLIVKLYFYEQYQPYALNNLNRLDKNTYLLSIFCLILIFQLIKQIPIITYTILAIVNLAFIYQVTIQLKICFFRQYRNLIQSVTGKIIEKISIFKKNEQDQFKTSQQNLLKFKLTVSKILLNKSKTSKYSTQVQLIQCDQQSLIKIGGEIELQSVQVISPFQEQKQSE